ncbi:hypothetical protein ACQ4PT_050355 [Festuca glaucescens]
MEVRNTLPVWSFSDTAWVASADGEAVWDFCLSTEPSLMDLITGSVKRLPLFWEDNYDDIELRIRMRKPRGVVYADGTVLLYSFVPEENECRYAVKKHVFFTAAILCPGDTAWMMVEKILNWPVEDNSCAAYHNGKLLVWMGTHFWCYLTHDVEADDGGHIAGVRLEMTCEGIEQGRYTDNNNYVLESGGELFWVFVLVDHEWIRRNTCAMCDGDSVVPELLVMVHALEEDADGDDIGKMRWVERDGWSLGDRVLFLGIPASFTMNATQLGIDGGCAYFVYWHRSLIDGKTQYVDWPCRGWIPPDVHVWLRPQPAIAPIQEIQGRLTSPKQEPKNKKKVAS